VNLYCIIRDWVDRQWCAPGLQFKVLLLPAMLPLLVILMIGKTPVLDWAGWAWFGAWTIFVFWRWWIYIKMESRKSDLQYDRKGKFRLSREYHDTESATAAKERKRRG